MENCVQIGQGELKIRVAKPGTVYSRRRFDWTGFIPEITFCGKAIAVAESLEEGKGTGGIGLCSEFKMADMWEENEKLFLKPGVGLLERPDLETPYSFDYDYPLIKPFDCKMSWGDNWVDFALEEIELRGVAYRENRHISVMGNALVITTTIENTGKKQIKLQEYNHNFISLGGLGAHKGASMTIHRDYYNAGGEVKGLVMEEEKLVFTDEFNTGFMIYVRNPRSDSPMRWEMCDTEAGLRVQEWGDFPVTRFLAWGQRHVIAPEIYGDFDVAPGEKRSWTRMWKFYCD